MIKNDNKFQQNCGFLKSDIDTLNEEFKKIITEQIEENYHFLKNEEKSLIEVFLESKWKIISLICLKFYIMKDR